MTLQQSNLTALQAVIKPLEGGLLSFNRLSEILISVVADIVTPGCQTFDEFRREVQEMKNHLNESENIASKELQDLDKKTETLTVDKTNLEKKRKDQDAKLKELKTCLDSLQYSSKNWADAQDAEKRNLESANKTLKDMENRRAHGQTVKDVGIGVLAIPIVGWIAGGIMIGVGEADLSSARDQVNKANEMVEECESQMKAYAKKVSDCNHLISKAEEEIKEVNRRIPQTEAELQALSVKRKTVADLQSQTRTVVNHLGLLSGVGKSAELQTRKLILVETVTKVMDELTPLLTQIIGNCLLPTEGLKSIMEDLKTNNRKLKANLNEEKNDYY